MCLHTFCIQSPEYYSVYVYNVTWTYVLPLQKQCMIAHINFSVVNFIVLSKDNVLHYYICDWICEKVPFPHILHTGKQNDVTLDSLY